MIKKIENSDEFLTWNKKDIFAIKIFALAKSYGLKYNFATFYRQIIDGKTVSLISKLDNDFTISLTNGFDNDELLRFFCISGYTSITCDEQLTIGAKYTEGIVMSNSNRTFDDPLPINTIIDEYPKLMDLYNFVDYENQDFKAWYVDISHRVRHKTAKAYTLCFNGSIISSGILNAIYDNNAILTAVRTDDEYRNLGYGSALVKYICSDVKGAVYLMREKNLNEHFYKHLGFENIGLWRIYK